MAQPQDNSNRSKLPEETLRSDQRSEEDVDSRPLDDETGPDSVIESTVRSAADTDPASLSDTPRQRGQPGGSNVLQPEDSGSQSTVIGDAAHQQDKAATPTAVQQIGNFRIRRPLGRGGMGVVYLADDETLNRQVAVKVLRSGTDAEPHELQRFRREAQVIAQIRHPHIVQVHEVGESGGLVYLVLEYMNGGALSEFLDGTPLPEKLAARILSQLADATCAAHRQGVVHRDLKPGNVLVSLPPDLEADDSPAARTELTHPGIELKLADFGLAKSIDTDVVQTHPGVIVGTPRYAAPEQLTAGSEPVSPATDIYSLGAILFELVTGAPVFRSADLAELISAVRLQEPVAPRLLNNTVSRDLETICLKCLQKSPADRYSSAEHLRDDLTRFLNGEPILARPVGRMERTLKWMRRHPVTAALWTTSLLALLAMVGVVVSLMYQGELQEVNQELLTTQNSLEDTNETLQQAQDTLEDRNRELQEKNVQLQAAYEEARRATDMLSRFRYIVDTQVASRAWNEGDVAQMKSILERHRDTPDHLRGWEWNYLNGLLLSDLGHLHGQTAEFSADGTLLAVGRPDGVVLLNGVTLELIREFEGPDTWAIDVAFSADGKRLIAGCSGEHTLVWNVADGSLVTDFVEHSWGGYTALNSDGSLALTTGLGDDRTVKLWRVDDGSVLLSWYAEGGQYAAGIGFSRDDRWFAVGWPPTSSVRLARVDAPADFIDIPVESDSSYYGSRDPAVEFDPVQPWVWVSNGGQVSRVVLPDSEHQTEQQEDSSPDADVNRPSTAASGGEGRPTTPQLNLVRTKMKGSLLDVTPDGSMLLTASGADHSVRVWQVEGEWHVNTIRGQDGDVKDLSLQNPAARPDKAVVSISAAPDGYLWIRDCLRSPDFEQIFVGFSPIVVQYGSDDRYLVAAGPGGQAAIVREGVVQPLTGAEGAAWDVATSSDGSMIAVVFQSGLCCLWSAEDSRLLHEIRPSGMQSAYTVAFNGDATRLAIGGDAGQIVIVDPSTGQELSRQAHGTNMVSRVTFHPVTDELVTAAFGSVMFWGSEPPRVLDNINAPGLQFTQDGSAFLARGGHVESDELLVDAATGDILRRFAGHQATISGCALMKDGTRLVTVGDTNGRPWGTGTLRIWDFETGEEALRLESGGARSVTVSSDGRRIAATTMGGPIRIYDSHRFASEKSPGDSTAD